MLQKKLYFLVEQLQTMARDLPPYVIHFPNAVLLCSLRYLQKISDAGAV